MSDLVCFGKFFSAVKQIKEKFSHFQTYISILTKFGVPKVDQVAITCTGLSVLGDTEISLQLEITLIILTNEKIDEEELTNDVTAAVDMTNGVSSVELQNVEIEKYKSRSSKDEDSFIIILIAAIGLNNRISQKAPNSRNFCSF